MSYQDSEVTYNDVIVDRLVSKFFDNSEGPQEHIETMISQLKAQDPNMDIITYKDNIINHTNVGEVSINNRLEAKILDKAVDTILRQTEHQSCKTIAQRKGNYFTTFKRAKSSKCTNYCIILIVKNLLLSGSQSRSKISHYNKITSTPDNRENTLK